MASAGKVQVTCESRLLERHKLTLGMSAVSCSGHPVSQHLLCVLSWLERATTAKPSARAASVMRTSSGRPAGNGSCCHTWLPMPLDGGKKHVALKTFEPWQKACTAPGVTLYVTSIQFCAAHDWHLTVDKRCVGSCRSSGTL